MPFSPHCEMRGDGTKRLGSKGADDVSKDSLASDRPHRTSEQRRATKESDIAVQLDLDGAGETDVSTGLPFFDHMLSQLGKHGGVDFSIATRGDLHVDAHHSVEDTGIVLGAALREALGDKVGIRRFASISIPLDEALVDVALDISGRPYLRYAIDFAPETLALGSPPFDPQLAEEFWRAFVQSAEVTLHISCAYGKNTHHILEASFKAVGRALRDAKSVEGSAIPSTKGLL
jgi:imidazoleglycerol-phosphate dehydratase